MQLGCKVFNEGNLCTLRISCISTDASCKPFCQEVTLFITTFFSWSIFLNNCYPFWFASKLLEWLCLLWMVDIGIYWKIVQLRISSGVEKHVWARSQTFRETYPTIWILVPQSNYLYPKFSWRINLCFSFLMICMFLFQKTGWWIYLLSLISEGGSCFIVLMIGF